jgi:uncharacterized membrane protein
MRRKLVFIVVLLLTLVGIVFSPSTASAHELA